MPEGTLALPLPPPPAAARDRRMLWLGAAFVGVALAFAAAAAAAGDVFYLRLGTEALILAGLALSVELLLGGVGLLSLGQALYFGLGAYAAALLLRDGYGFWPAIGAATALGALAGLVGGGIAIRARGVYFALITFGLAQVVAKAVYNTRALGASDGMTGVPEIWVPLGITSVHAADPLGFFLVLLGLLLAVLAGLAWLLDTPYGRALRALRANAARVPFLGYRSWALKLSAFTLAAAVAALFGGLYPVLRGFVSPELLYFNVSGNAVIGAVLGGVGTLIGPVVGSVLLTGFKSVLGSLTEHHLIAVGLLFMGAVLFLPDGLAGLLRRRERP